MAQVINLTLTHTQGEKDVKLKVNSPYFGIFPYFGFSPYIKLNTSNVETGIN